MHLLKTNHRIALDVLWIDWSSAFDQLTFKLSEGDNPEFNALIGNSAHDTFPLHWKDSYAFRLGYEYSFSSSDILRLGYVYNKNPVPDSTLTPLIPGIMTQILTFGYSHNWSKWTLNFAYSYSFGPRRSVSTSKIIGGDYDHSSVKVDAHFFALAIQYHFDEQKI